MSDTRLYPLIKLGEVLKLDTEYVQNLEPRIYPKLSVKLYGRGVVLDQPTDGATVRMKRHQLAKEGQVILSEIWAKKGAIGIVPKEGAGALTTSHFFLFDIQESKLYPGYMEWLLKANYFGDSLSFEARGTTGYAAIRPKQFLMMEIPLPLLAEQQRIVGRIEELAGKVEEARRLRDAAAGETNRLVTSLSRTIFANANWPEVPLFELLTEDTRNGIGRKPSDEPIGVPILRISAGTSRSDAIVDETDHKYIEVTERELEAYTLQKDDLLACRFNGNLHFVGRFSLYQGFSNQVQVYPDKLIRFRVDKSKVMPEYVRIAANSPKVRGVIEGFCATTAGNLGISAANLKTVTIPVPPLNTQKQIVELVDQMHAKVNTLIKLQANTQHEIDALLPSILDKAFKGEL